MAFNLRQFLFWFSFVVFESLLLFAFSFTPRTFPLSLPFNEQVTVDVFMFLLTFGTVFAIPILRHDLFHSHRFAGPGPLCSTCTSLMVS